jgi:hypothetical protein
MADRYTTLVADLPDDGKVMGLYRCRGVTPAATVVARARSYWQAQARQAEAALAALNPGDPRRMHLEITDGVFGSTIRTEQVTLADLDLTDGKDT